MTCQELEVDSKRTMSRSRLLMPRTHTVVDATKSRNTRGRERSLHSSSSFLQRHTEEEPSRRCQNMRDSVQAWVKVKGGLQISAIYFGVSERRSPRHETMHSRCAPFPCWWREMLPRSPKYSGDACGAMKDACIKTPKENLSICRQVAHGGAVDSRMHDDIITCTGLEVRVVDKEGDGRAQCSAAHASGVSHQHGD